MDILILISGYEVQRITFAFQFSNTYLVQYLKFYPSLESYFSIYYHLKKIVYEKIDVILISGMHFAACNDAGNRVQRSNERFNRYYNVDSL